jgi:hypothetical protein
MASGDNTTTVTPASKPEAPAAPASVGVPAKTGDAASSAAAPAATDAKAAPAETAAPASHSRGEGQKPVSQAYRDNWNAIFGAETTLTPTSRAKAQDDSRIEDQG